MKYLSNLLSLTMCSNNRFTYVHGSKCLCVEPVKTTNCFHGNKLCTYHRYFKNPVRVIASPQCTNFKDWRRTKGFRLASTFLTLGDRFSYNVLVIHCLFHSEEAVSANETKKVPSCRDMSRPFSFFLSVRPRHKTEKPSWIHGSSVVWLIFVSDKDGWYFNKYSIRSPLPSSVPPPPPAPHRPAPALRPEKTQPPDYLRCEPVWPSGKALG